LQGISDNIHCMHETKKLLSSTCKVNQSAKNKPASDCEVFI